MKSILLLFFVLFNLNASFAQDRLDLNLQIDQATQLLQNISDNPEQIEREFRNVYQFLLNVNPELYDIHQLRRNTNVIVNKLAMLRNQIRDQIETWKAQGKMDAQFEKELRGILRASHYLADYVSEISMDNETAKKGQTPRKAFSSGAPWTTTIDGQPMNYNDFKSGDILLMRGGSAVSASIARIADFKSIFSHIGIVYVDEKTGEKFVLEALIEVGVTINSLKKTLDKSAARMSVIRPVDAELGRKAAQIGYDLVSDSLKKKKPFLYDFTMSSHQPDLNNLEKEKFFCSKFVWWVYDLASNQKINLPFIPSRMEQNNRSFLRRLAISDQTKSMFAPGDIELEPNSRFQVIAEFREPQRTAALRTDDLIFDKLFEWMERDGLTFDEPQLLKVLGVAAYSASYISLVQKTAAKKGIALAPHVPADVITTVIMLQFMRDGLLKKIQPEMDSYFKKTGFAAPPRVIYGLLEKAYQEQPGLLKYLSKPAPGSCKKAVAN